MFTRESRSKAESTRVEARSLGCPPRISFGFMAGGLLVAAAAVAGVVVLAALTSWWVLFALLAVCPLLMMVGGLAMMIAVRGPMAGVASAAGACARWLRGDVGRATSAD